MDEGESITDEIAISNQEPSESDQTASHIRDSRGYGPFTDVEQNPSEIFMPIEGYENMALVSLDIAVAPLIQILPNVYR